MHDRQLSKFLSLLLRHKPETIGITLDTEGWTDIDVLLQKAAETDNQFDKEQLLLVVENNDKKRFEISDDGKKFEQYKDIPTRLLIVIMCKKYRQIHCIMVRLPIFCLQFTKKVSPLKVGIMCIYHTTSVLPKKLGVDVANLLF